MKVIGLGETVMDIIFKNDSPEMATPGGSTFNTMISLGRVGVDCGMVTFVGDDHVGNITCNYLRGNGVGTEWVTRRKGMKSHITLAFLDEKNDAQYTFYKEHGEVKVVVPKVEMRREDVLILGSFFAINPVIREEVIKILRVAKEAGAMVYYDVNFRAAHKGERERLLPNIEENMRMAGMVRGSADDFEILYDSRNPEEIYKKHIARHCPYFIYTAGGEEIHLFTPKSHTIYKVGKIETVSTVGAGDNFNAGWIYALGKMGGKIETLTQEEWDETVKMGMRWAQDVCCQIGNSISKEVIEAMR